MRLEEQEEFKKLEYVQKQIESDNESKNIGSVTSARVRSRRPQRMENGDNRSVNSKTSRSIRSPRKAESVDLKSERVNHSKASKSVTYIEDIELQSVTKSRPHPLGDEEEKLDLGG